MLRHNCIHTHNTHTRKHVTFFPVTCANGGEHTEESTLCPFVCVMECVEDIHALASFYTHTHTHK